ncbi:MAG: hypothetical protein AAF942_15440 [Pseudomonadota bacterium]
MNQLNLATTFAATIVLTIFSLTIWSFEDRPFEPSMKVTQTAYAERHADSFGGRFGVRGPYSLAASAEGKRIPHDFETIVPATAVRR